MGGDVCPGVLEHREGGAQRGGAEPRVARKEVRPFQKVELRPRREIPHPQPSLRS